MLRKPCKRKHRNRCRRREGTRPSSTNGASNLSGTGDASEASGACGASDERTHAAQAAQVDRGFPIHNLAGGGSHNLGYYAFMWETILHCNAGEFGKCTILNYLPDKIAQFLYEYHDSDFLSLDLPPLELDRSDTDVHDVLEPYQVDERFK
jgi:hypothetical protein